MATDALRSCGYCGKEGEKLLKCTRCKQVVYCGVDCQKAAWKDHKLACAKTSAQAKDDTSNFKKSVAQSIAPSRASRVLPSPLPRTTDIRLAGVLSSYIGDQARLQRLCQCLKSVEQQSCCLAAFFVVWSAPDELAHEVDALLARFKQALHPSPIHTLRQTKRTSQFFDMKWLYNECIAKEPSGTWLLFTDDDDLWSPERVRTYHSVINQFAYSPGTTAVCATHKVRPAHRLKVAQSAEEVAQHLKSGDARHAGGVKMEEEFFDFSCPHESLGSFLDLCNDATLLHPFADLRFTRFMSEYYVGGKVMYFPTDKVNPWVYYYSTAFRRPEDGEAFEQYQMQDQASTVVKVIPSDRADALAMCRQCSGGMDPTTEELDDMIEFVSGLRQNIDAMLIRHFPDEPMRSDEMRRVAVGQIQGQGFAAGLAVQLAEQSCKRFGISVS